ncbi:NYN domain-containing protein [Patescibacteria group bacterium]|nr:NYN domain-containing protein [Patescibacteria group bacterium]MBU2633134.1 NYN domain-containing protein [Patescibacteria group bacterium]
MKKKENNYVFIDSNNLNLAIKDCGWSLNFYRFRVYLREKYNVSKAFLFIGYVKDNQDLYTNLQEAGYLLIFKPTLEYKEGKTKGNCDAELVLQAMIEYKNYDKALIVTGDGDFHCLIKYFIKQNKLKKLLIPSQSRYSALLKKFPSEYLAFVSDLRKKLEYKKKKTQ